MSMLAEPKIKSKYSINPRGLDWVNDESKFGQKLMEKMGWSKGQGLGAKKDGNTDHIHVSVKVDKRGVGFSKKAAEEWLDHQDGFSNILDELNAEHVDPNTNLDGIDGQQIGLKLLPLEHKSKNSSGRIHYQKFTKSKDLSVKNSNDLDCIFGTKARKNTSLIRNQEDTSVLEKKNSDFGVKTSTSILSSHQYFANKLNELKEKSNKSESKISESNNSINTTPLDIDTIKCNKKRKENDLNHNEVKKRRKNENSKHSTLENIYCEAKEESQVDINGKISQDKKSIIREDVLASSFELPNSRTKKKKVPTATLR